jgi:serine/threonine protein kinase
VAAGKSWSGRRGNAEVTRDQAQPPVEAEVVHAGRRARVVRVHLGGRTIIRKEPLGPGAEAGLRHETMILELLRGARGVAQLLDSPRYPGALVLEDVGSASVADLTKPLAADELMALAVDLVRALAEVHGRGVIHGNISPSNIVISSRGDPYLVDFAMGARFAEIRPQFGPHSEIL